ncbi:MAG: ATP-dependent helicase, partial [Candidatus Omnitrophica bacterium]|nr:ATP-dependent helicase [Candidatus Omnitrophota bacterium]
GSGKTRTLTQRVAELVRSGTAQPEQCLTLTFTRRAAEEMRSRLQKLLPEECEQIPVCTFHGLAYRILQENYNAAGLPQGFEVVAEKDADHNGVLDYEELMRLALSVLEDSPDLCAQYRQRYAWVSIDEYQDIDESQYRLIRLLAPDKGNVCVIGDPDQAIYRFRGADVGFFLRFEEDYPGARKVFLSRNYRSGESIFTASRQMMAPGSLLEDRQVQAIIEDTGKVVLHCAKTDKAEAEFVVHRIEQLIGGTTFFSMDSGRSEGDTEREYSFADFAVLVRAKAQLDCLEEALERSGIPYQAPARDPWQDVDEWDPRADRVSLLTLHAAKGLEFPVVFITGCEEGLLPMSWGGKSSEEELAEERRLFFVGMTRAEDRLFLCHAKRRLWQGKIRERTISRFLQDIEERLLEHSLSAAPKRRSDNSQLNFFD